MKLQTAFALFIAIAVSGCNQSVSDTTEEPDKSTDTAEVRLLLDDWKDLAVEMMGTVRTLGGSPEGAMIESQRSAVLDAIVVGEEYLQKSRNKEIRVSLDEYVNQKVLRDLDVMTAVPVSIKLGINFLPADDAE